jgi:hypothetical protein
MAKRMLGLERSEWSFWRKWMLVSMVAWTGVGGAGSVVFFLAYASLYSLGGSLSDVMDLFRPLVAGWALLGAGIGAAQGIFLWLLQSSRPPFGRWVLTATSGGAVGGAVTMALLVLDAAGEDWRNLSVCLAIFVIGGVFGGAVYSVVTGLVLGLLRRQPTEQNSKTEA